MNKARKIVKELCLLAVGVAAVLSAAYAANSYLNGGFSAASQDEKRFWEGLPLENAPDDPQTIVPQITEQSLYLNQNPTQPFKLPVEGSTVYAAVEMMLYGSADKTVAGLQPLTAGTPFVILQEQGDWWQVMLSDGATAGWVEHIYCFINLPDVVPSIIYDNSNVYASAFLSSGKPLPEITGAALYEGYGWNERLQKEEFTMPVLYATAKKISRAQQLALAAGDTLVIEETYRPYEVQQRIVQALSALAQQDSEVLRGISQIPWSMGWFIAQGISHHQRGCALDVTLAKVLEQDFIASGDSYHRRITAYEEYRMPTSMHELSAASASLAQPVDAASPTAWKDVPTAAAMQDAALALRDYCTDAGLTPLASEWWHFNDLDAWQRTIANACKGGFSLGTVLSVAA